MYLPKLFAQTDTATIAGLLAAYPLAQLVTHGRTGLEASPLPLLYDPAPRPEAPFGVLRGHFARANPQWQNYQPGSEAMALFTGPNAYVSPNWYPGKAEHHKAVPTWNYAVVEARGPLTLIEDPAALRELLTALTATHENPRPQPWSLADAPEEFLAAQFKAIVGVEMAVQQLTGKWKMSQNRSPADQAGVRAGLAADGSTDALATRAAMPPLPSS